jgi:signal peptidase I
VALIDGDVFVRRPDGGEANPPGGTWLREGWSIQRKSERIQRAVWQHVFSSDYEPLHAPAGYTPPWQGGPGWSIAGRRDYEYRGSGPTALDWAVDRWPIWDFYPYNETSDRRPMVPNPRQDLTYAVNDVAMRCVVEPGQEPLSASAVVRARGQEFRADIIGRDVTLKMGALGGSRPDGRGRQDPTQWTTLASGRLPHALEAGRLVGLEFWHTDQALWLFSEGRLVAHGTYDWSLRERISKGVGLDIEEVIRTDQETHGNMLALVNLYRRAETVRWEFSGPVTLHHVALDRDIHYQPARPGQGGATERPRAAHPLRPMILSPDQFFVCGDNSPASLDARLWGAPDPWVAAAIDPTDGVVPRHLMIGRAFFVYFPSLIRNPGKWSPLPMPDFGRMRFIW